MADELYALTAVDVATLQDLIAAYRRGDLGQPYRPTGNRFLPSVMLYAAKSGSTGMAAATTGGVSGSASVSLCTISSSGSITATTKTLTAYNLSSGAVAANTWIHLKREALTGRWLVDFEDCG